MPNKTFLRAATLLCHPLAIAAMLVLLFNDHWLRWYAPSWWTGKLGDFAWLFFAPFAAAMLLARLIPPSPRQEKIVRALAFGLVGGIFALAKTVPVVHAVVAQIAEMILRVPIGLRRDPTDLIALASLGAAWWFWERHAIPARASTAPGLIALLLAAMLTLANGPAPDYGITGFELSGDTVIARSAYGAWKSTDGGLTWTETSAQGLKPLGLFATTWGVQRTAIVTDTLNANVLYRATPLVSIERSKDGGQTWRVDFAMTPLSEAAGAYANRRPYGFFQGPVNGIVDARTGNAIFAMGHEGVLVRKPSGDYVWGAVDRYRHFEFNDPMALLNGELILAISVGLLVLATLAARLLKHRAAYVVTGLAWLVWLGDSVLFPPGRSSNGYGLMLAYFTAVMVFGVGCATSAILVLITARRSLEFVARAFLIALVSVPLYFAPFYLWALNVIPSYTAALLIAFALGAGLLIAGWRVMHQFLPSSQTSQKANDANPQT